MLTAPADVRAAWPDPPGAGMSEDMLDLIEWDEQRDWPGGEIDFSAFVTEPTRLDKLYFEVVDLLDAKSWYGETQKITIRRNLRRPGEGGRPAGLLAAEDDALLVTEGGAYLALDPALLWRLTDEANIVAGTASADLNEKSRLTRVTLYWDRKILEKDGEAASYNAVDIAVDADAEGENEAGSPIEEKIFCRWLRRGYLPDEQVESFVRALATRRVWRRRDALPIIAFDVEIKDGEIRTGEWIRLSTDALVRPDGAPISEELFQIIRREPGRSRIGLRALKVSPRRVAVFAPAGHPDYDVATEDERTYGYFSDDRGEMPGGDDGYYFW